MLDAARLRHPSPLLWLLMLIVLALVCLAVSPARADEVGGAAPAPTAVEEPQLEAMRLSMMLGGLISLSSQADTATAPLLTFAVDAALRKGDPETSFVPHLMVAGHFGALPGETISAEDPATFDSLRFEAGVRARPLRSFLADIYALGGYATRRPGDDDPTDKAARYWSVGLRFADAAGDNALLLGGGQDQRLDESWRWAAHVSGIVKMPVNLTVVSAHLMLQTVLDMDRRSLDGAVDHITQVAVVLKR